jgi:hypothetical protein
MTIRFLGPKTASTWSARKVLRREPRSPREWCKRPLKLQKRGAAEPA